MAATEEDMISSSTVEVEECLPPSPGATASMSAPTMPEPPQLEEPACQLEEASQSDPASQFEQASQSEPASQTEPSSQSELASQTGPSSQSEPASLTGPSMQTEPASQTESSSQPEPASQPEPEEEFSWEEYLEETNTEAVPPSTFQHVERSLESGIFVDQLVEVVDPSCASPGYWLARVVTTCGPLLRLRYLTQSSINVECWREIAQGGLHPVGWCSTHSIPLTVPPDLSAQLEEESVKQEAIKAVEEAQKVGVSVPEEALDIDGYTAIDRIKCGMKVEVLWEGDALCGWVATVTENVGGRLLLRYDTPDCSGPTSWLFYQHARLRPPDWLHLQDHPHRYSHPASSLTYEDAEWAALLELSRDGARHSSIPCSLLTHTSLPEPHNIAEGVFLEAVHPFKPFSIHACKVVEVIDPRYFRVSLESKTEVFLWTTHIGDPLLLPCGYCKEFGLTLEPPRDWQGESSFEWNAYLGESPAMLLATQEMFPKCDSAEDLGFCTGNRLEVVNPSDPSQICVATVKQMGGHLVVVQLDSEREPTSVIYAADSQDLFPTGWCQANNYPLQLPAEYTPRPVQLQPSQSEQSQGSDSNDTAAGGGAVKSLWCPRLYVNHWCYTGPYLSKSKVAKQSQSVGPGSVELVLREVLSMTINAAYIPTRVLRELERNGPDATTVCPTWRSTPFKAKFKRYAYTANIPIATRASDVSDFLYSICQTLQCCPNLWSSVPSGENCPLLCTSQMTLQGGQSSGMRGRGKVAVNRSVRGCPGATRILHRRKRGGRKRLFVPVRANRLLPSKNLTPAAEEVLEEAEEEEEAEIEEVEEYDVGSGSDGDTSSRSSRPTSPLLEQGQVARRQRKVFPRVDMQAKGMKFPEYNAQMKARQKRKFEGQDGASGCREECTERREPMKRGRKSEFPDTSSGLEPATVRSDPLEWTVHDVEQYVAGQPAICHHAVKLRQQEVDGRAFLLLNLPTLVQHLGLPHSSAVALAQHICRVKLAHFLFYKPEP